MKSPIVSIIIPVFNDQDRIARSIQSAQNQSLTPLEIIVIDDGSTDRTPTVLADLAARDSRIVILKETCGGAYRCRNLGLDHASGKYIAFLDSDDWVAPTIYADMIEAIERLQTDSAICSSTRHLEKTNEEAPHYSFDQWREFVKVGEDNIHLINGALWNKLYRRKHIEKERMRFIDSRIAADSEFNWRYYLDYPTVAVVKKPLYHYVLREGSLANRPQNKTSLDSLKSFDTIKQNLVDRAVFKTYRHALYAFITPRILERLLLERMHMVQYALSTLKVFGVDYLRWSIIELNVPKIILRAIKKRYVAS